MFGNSQQTGLGLALQNYYLWSVENKHRTNFNFRLPKICAIPAQGPELGSGWQSLLGACARRWTSHAPHFVVPQVLRLFEHIPPHLPPSLRLLFQAHIKQIPNQMSCINVERETPATCTLQVDVFIWLRRHVPGTAPSGGWGRSELWREMKTGKKIEYRLLLLQVCCLLFSFF